MPWCCCSDCSGASGSTKLLIRYIFIRKVFHFLCLYSLRDPLIIHIPLPRLFLLLNLFLIVLLPDDLVKLLLIKVFVDFIFLVQVLPLQGGQS